MSLPASVLAGLTGGSASPGVRVAEHRLSGSTGAATRAISRLTLELHDATTVSLIRKEFQPLRTGPHHRGAEDPGHWAYWKRELLAYESGLLPDGADLRAPRCHAIVDDTLYLEDAGSTPPDPREAAHALAGWQATSNLPDVPWLSGHQLAQRVEVSNLDWSTVDADPRAERLWSNRATLLDELARVPPVLSHGDFHLGNLRAAGGGSCGGGGGIVGLDWGTLGRAPVGSDLAHLALSTQHDLLAVYLTELNGRFDKRAATLGYRATLALVGASRLHWMLSRGITPPDSYADFLWDNRPIN